MRIANLWLAVTVVFSLALAGVSVMIMFNSVPNGLKEIQVRLPESTATWHRSEQDRFFDQDSIFDYIDGGGEVYRSYSMRQCLSRRYIHPSGATVILDIFDMGNSQNAYGVFTHDQDGEPMPIGQGALYRPGWLSFWKGPYFVSVYADQESDETVEMVKWLGDHVAGMIRNEGPRPPLLDKLPAKGLDKRSIRFFHDHLILNYHYYLANENIMDLGRETDAVLADYSRNDSQAKLLLAEYPDAASSEAAADKFIRHYLPDADTSGLGRLENGQWAGMRRNNNRLVIVLEAHSRDLAKALLDETSHRERPGTLEF